MVLERNLWGLSYYVEISLWGMYLGTQLVERDLKEYS